MDRASGKHILFVHPPFARDAAGFPLEPVMAELRRRGHQPVLAAGLARVTAPPASTVLEQSSWLEGVTGSRFSGRPVDIVHAFGFAAGRLGARLAEQHGWRYVLTLPRPLSWWTRLFYRAWSDPLMVIDENDVRTGGFRFRAPAVRFMPVGVDAARFHRLKERALPLSPASAAVWCNQILTVSRLSAREVPVVLAAIDAFARYVGKFPETRLGMTVIGDGPAASLIDEHIRAMRAQIIPGTVRRLPCAADLEYHLKTARLVIAAATTALEALAAGIPVIAAGPASVCGLVTPANFEACRRARFGDRGRRKHLAAAERIFMALLETLHIRSTWVADEAEYLSSLVVGHHSVQRTVDRLERIYDGSSARPRITHLQ